MDVVGIICEYNPFHNGHLYHIEKTKELFPDSVIVLVMSGPFTQRGDISILNKWEKTKIALNHKVDLVIELPFKYASQSADVFAKGAISILNYLACDYLVFGSESNKINELTMMAKMQLEDNCYNLLVKEYLDEGMSYPSALSKAFEVTMDIVIDKPNDILGLAYVKEIIKQKAKIKPISIKRSNDYHSTNLNSEIVSATAIRKALKEKKDIKKYVPKDTLKALKGKSEKDAFELFKYKVLSEDNLAKYQTVDEGLDNRVKNLITESNNLDEFMRKVKTKRYTYNRIKRMTIHILCSLTKEEAIDTGLMYIRVLGFSNEGQKYLNKVKKDINIDIINNMKKKYDDLLALDNRAEQIYQLINQESLNTYKNSPIKKQD